MALGERDPVTGRRTTGHDWNGITELDTPIPRIVFFFLIATFLFSLLWWILMPAWPLVTTYTKGILGADQTTDVESSLAAAKQARSAWADRIVDMDWTAIETDKDLMKKVTETGHQLFGDNCAACHGADAKGGDGYPDLTDDDWIWGGGPETIAETLRVGVNAISDETRISQMPAFGRDEILDRVAVSNVARYVLSLSDPSTATPDTNDRIAAGKEIFAANCASCHGDGAMGDIEIGAPNLTDRKWIYGGNLQTIIDTIHGGRLGHMPSWETRLSTLDIRILALYVNSLRVDGQ